MIMGGVPGLEQNYQYGLYGQGGKIAFGGVTVGAKVSPATAIEPTTGISSPGQVGYVKDESGNKISLGQDGVGLAHRDAKDYGYMLVA